MKTNKKISKIFCIFLIAAVMTLTMSSFAVCVNADELVTNPPEESYEQVLSDLTNTIRGLSVSFIALAAIATAFWFMTSAMNPENMNYAKMSLVGLILGVVVLVFANDIGKIMFGALDKNPNDLNSLVGGGGVTIGNDATEFGEEFKGDSGSSDDDSDSPDPNPQNAEEHLQTIIDVAEIAKNSGVVAGSAKYDEMIEIANDCLDKCNNGQTLTPNDRENIKDTCKDIRYLDEMPESTKDFIMYNN